jgi:hypothetical protein
MSLDGNFLYQRLPAIHRTRDAANNLALQALMMLLGERCEAVESDIDELYQNWFIETCDDWVVPYIGDLLGVKLLRSNIGVDGYSARALVADTLVLRRRKGTPGALETLTTDCTGWPCHVVEFFELLATTQCVNHVRLANVRTPDLRNSAHLELLDTAFDDIAHTAAVRHIPGDWYNIPNIGLFVWRLESYPLTAVMPFAPPNHLPGLYRFDPIGRDQPLFNYPQSLPADEFARTTERNLPAALRRRALFDELAARRASGSAVPGGYFAAPNIVVTITVNGAAIPPEQIYICHLDDLPGGPPTDWPRPAAGAATTVAIDPVLGRMSFPAGLVVNSLAVDYSYGFPGNLGGGPYERRTGPNDPLAPAIASGVVQLWQVPNTSPLLSPGALGFATLADALVALNGAGPNSVIIIEILDDATYTTGPVNVAIPGVTVTIQGRDQCRPVWVGNITITGDRNTSVTLNGLAVNGNVTLTGPLGLISIDHSTIVPAAGGISCTAVAAEGVATLRLRRSISGPITAGTLDTLELSESIIDGLVAGVAIATPSTSVSTDRCTVVGTVAAEILALATNTLFDGIVIIARRQEGCVRFSFVPPTSTTPRQFRCQPDLAIEKLSGAAAQAEIARLVPIYTSEDFSRPAYRQLAVNCATELTTGADNGAEMGAWNFLQQPQRQANLMNALNDYLRAGLEAGLIFVT